MAKVGVIVLFISILAWGSEKVVFGTDDRKDLFEIKNSKYLSYSKAVAGMISNKDIISENGKISLKFKTLLETGICDTEKFVHQPTPVYCTGFLISSNILVTAAHCIMSQSDCDNYSWIFDYSMKNSDQTQGIDAKNIYRCSKILMHEYDENTGIDHALIQLDRPINNRMPLRLRKSGITYNNEPLVVLGHPSGLPQKVADNAKVTSLESTYFIANLDAFGGNSGAPVISTRTGMVEGILVRGEEDYIQSTQRKCRVTNVMPNDSDGGEEVAYITNIKGISEL